jgi:hypothetical protein
MAVARTKGMMAMEPEEITGRPDETWTEKQRAEYEALKAKWVAELAAEPDWLNQPTEPVDELVALLDRYLADSQTAEGPA